jgi:2-dehydropantoate 2-reductase
MGTKKGESLMLVLLAECQAMAAAGYPPRQEHGGQCRAMLTERGSDNSASMRRDLKAGRRTEGEAILGGMLPRAQAAGIPMPMLRAAVCHLQVREKRLAAPGCV